MNQCNSFLPPLANMIGKLLAIFLARSDGSSKAWRKVLSLLEANLLSWITTSCALLSISSTISSRWLCIQIFTKSFKNFFSVSVIIFSSRSPYWGPHSRLLLASEVSTSVGRSLFCKVLKGKLSLNHTFRARTSLSKSDMFWSSSI